MNKQPYTHDRPSVQKVVRMVQEGKIDSVDRWSYYASRREINRELIRLGLMTSDIVFKLFALEDSAKESL